MVAVGVVGFEGMVMKAFNIELESFTLGPAEVRSKVEMFVEDGEGAW